MKVAIIAVGIPGSGKTTLLKPLAERNNYAYINKDEIRDELFGDSTIQTKNEEVWEESNHRIRKALMEGQTVIIDSVNVEVWKRKELIRFVRDAGAAVVYGLVVDVPIEIAKERNSRRERKVRDVIIEWMHEQFTKTPPTLDEGFDELFYASDLDRLETITMRDE